MIKVNLLRQKASGPKASTKVGTFANLKAPSMEGDNKAIMLRFAAILVPIVLAYFLGAYNKNILNNEIVALNSKITNFDKQIGDIKPQLTQIESLNAEKNKLNQEVLNLRAVSKKRYLMAKALDAIQTLIPDKAWLVKLSSKNNSFVVEGRAPDDQSVSTFMENLEQSTFFSNVTWIDSREVNEPQGIVKLFNIQFNLEAM